jgi:polysaccharide biosynthesis protein VpsQ
MKQIRIITIAFFLFFVYVIWAADNNVLPAWIIALYHYPNGDKVGHFLILGLLAFLINCSLPNLTVRLFTLSVPIGTMIVTALAIVEEISQSFFPARTFSLLDLGSSLSGIIVYSFLSLVVIRIFKFK